MICEFISIASFSSCILLFYSNLIFCVRIRIFLLFGSVFFFLILSLPDKIEKQNKKKKTKKKKDGDMSRKKKALEENELKKRVVKKKKKKDITWEEHMEKMKSHVSVVPMSKYFFSVLSLSY